jgi:hypothetical protein
MKMHSLIAKINLFCSSHILQQVGSGIAALSKMYFNNIRTIDLKMFKNWEAKMVM